MEGEAKVFTQLSVAKPGVYTETPVFGRTGGGFKWSRRHGWDMGANQFDVPPESIVENEDISALFPRVASGDPLPRVQNGDLFPRLQEDGNALSDLNL